MHRVGFLAITLITLGLTSLHADHPKERDRSRVELVDGLGNVQHPVSTKSEAAQRYFDQGLAFIFAFNHDEAIRAFRRTAELDPKLAMAQWGIALALGPNYNLDAEPDQAKQAYEAVQKAVQLAAGAPEQERGYVEALAKRYSADANADKKKLALAYKEAMGELAKRYPDDLDAATLYAESAMNLRPWELWSADGKPAEGTEEIIAVLESVLRRNPEHTGANHYYIHAVEASLTPERGLAAANRLGALAPNAGHLVHMPSHIYIRTGDYALAAKVNEIAAEVDRKYIEESGVKGVYPMMYYSHNIHFIAVAHAMQGRYEDALKASERLVAHVSPHLKDMPMLEGFLPMTTVTLLRFHRWDELLVMPPPAEKLTLTTAFWRFGRGLALAAKGDVAGAQKEHEAFTSLLAKIPADAMFSPRNQAHAVLAVARHVFDARLAAAKGQLSGAIESLGKAVEAEDALKYMEPADWTLHVREQLGRTYLEVGRNSDAEAVFRAELARRPRSGRALFGLAEALRRQGKTHAAELVDREFKAAWRNAEGRGLKWSDL
jgi:tetratricopeptide (TPR) repeat protein